MRRQDGNFGVGHFAWVLETNPPGNSVGVQQELEEESLQMMGGVGRLGATLLDLQRAPPA